MATTAFAKTQAIPEGSSRRYQAQLLDADGVEVQAGTVTSIRFSLRDASTNAIVNNRDRVEVRNSNGGTLTASGVFALTLGGGDTISIGTSKMQKRRALFEVTFLAGVENHEVTFYIENLTDVPAPLTLTLGNEALHMADGAPTAALV